MMYFTYVLSMWCWLFYWCWFNSGQISGGPFPSEYQIAFHGKDWAEKIASELNTSMWGETDLVVTDGYSQASVLDHELHRYFLKDFFWSQASLPPVGVWGVGSRFGRVFDWTVDFSKFEGKNVAFVRAPWWFHHYEPVLWGITCESERIKWTKILAFMGRGFYAKRYIAQVMKPTWERHYPPFFSWRSLFPLGVSWRIKCGACEEF